MSRTRRAINGGVVLMLQMVLRLGTTIVVAPLLLHMENQATLGAYSILLQVVAYLTLLEFGISRAIGRQISQMANESHTEADRAAFLSTALTFLLFIGILAGILTMGLVWTLPIWLKADQTVLDSISSALLLFSAWMVLRFPLSLFLLIVFSRQRIALYGGLTIVGDVLRALLSLLFVWMGWGLVGLALANILAEFAMFSLGWYFGRKDIRGYRWIAFPDWEKLKGLLGIGMPLTLMSLGDRLTFYSQDIVTGWMLGAESTAVLYATRTPGFTLGSVLWRMIDSIVPGLNDLYGQRRMEEFKAIFYRIAGYAAGLGLWLAVVIYTFNQPVVELWLGESLYGGGAVSSGLSFLIFVATFNCVLTHFLIVEGKLMAYPPVVIGAGVISVVLAIIMGREWGLAGIMWSTGLANSLTTIFLLKRTQSMLGDTIRSQLSILTRRALRCALGGVAMCFLYLGATSQGLHLPWLAALMIVLVVGFAGFFKYGLMLDDQRLVLQILKRNSSLKGGR